MKYSSDVQNDAEKTPVKLERPRSLTIQLNEEPQLKDNVPSESETIKDADEIDVGKIDLDDEKVEEIITAAPEDPPSSELENPARKTPSHLTEQGYFDLKFYHNKLW
ncbi:hypothetical protein JTB14_037602 [Gonioctena quinquepunctata]|nr:hypothetical protein JTB14_037602 [Gonioctena quinquepunctata]